LPRFQHFVFAAVLGGLPLGGCTEKPDNQMKPNLANAIPKKLCQQVSQAAPRPTAAVVRPSIERAVPKKSGEKMASFDPSILVGLAPPAIDRILGRPAGMRAEAMTVEWSYKGQGCSLNIFFYPDIATGTLRALKYKVSNVKGQPAGNPACVNFLMMARSDESD
jgi:hypothetical protein